MPSNHFGPIPGIPVGTMWRFRVQVRVDVRLCGSASRRWLSSSPSAGEGHPKGRRLGWDSHQLLPWYGLDSGLQGLRVLLTGLMRLDRRVRLWL